MRGERFLAWRNCTVRDKLNASIYAVWRWWVRWEEPQDAAYSPLKPMLINILPAVPHLAQCNFFSRCIANSLYCLVNIYKCLNVLFTIVLPESNLWLAAVTKTCLRKRCTSSVSNKESLQVLSALIGKWQLSSHEKTWINWPKEQRLSYLPWVCFYIWPTWFGYEWLTKWSRKIKSPVIFPRVYT